MIEVRLDGSPLAEDALRAVRPGIPVVAVFAGDPGGAAPELVETLRRSLPGPANALHVDFTIDPAADVHAAFAGAPNPLVPVIDASRALTASGVAVRWRIPACAPLAYRLEALFSTACDEGVEPILVRGEATDSESRRFIADFVQYRLLDEERALQSPARLAWYAALLAELSGSHPPDRGEANTLEQAALIPAQDGRPSTAPREATEPPAEVAGVVVEGLRAMAQWALTAVRGRSRAASKSPQRELRRVLVIGAYGGDHIGDTAIFGGVLFRMHRRYGTREAILVSQRPAHSARLVAMLDTPVRVRVEDYRQEAAARLLREVDAVVFAGGPLMDLPKQLVKHLYTVARARRQGKPFVIEGIGAGPFIRKPSAWTARLLVRMAERITVRTAADGRQPLVQGLDPIVGRDPAFDYLDTRGRELTRVPEDDRRWLDRLFAGTNGRVTIGINLRPLRSDYTVGAPASQRAEYTRMVEHRFEERLAQAMTRLHQAAAPGAAPCFVFYPMNSIQFGSSDLRSACRLRRRLPPEVDFRVWEADPSIDGVVALLRRVDAAITMRFHATIYAISQRTRVIGVDYRPGKKDKVAALLDDLGEGDNCARVDEATADWLFDRLNAVTVPGPDVTASAARTA